MIRIAICDDDKDFCAQLEKYIFEYENRSGLKLDTSIFYSTEDLLVLMAEYEKPDLVFLDIKFSNMDGIAAGTVIREELLNDITQIVYVSSSESYAMDLFKNQPFDFIIKPVEYKSISDCMDKYCRKIAHTKVYYEFLANKVANKVAVQDIMYVSIFIRKLVIHTTYEIFETYQKLDDFLLSPPGSTFIRIHKSFAVNPIYIAGYHYDYIRLSNGEKLIISRSYKKEVREKILKESLIGV